MNGDNAIVWSSVAFVLLCYVVAFAYLPRARRLMLWIGFPAIMLLATRTWARRAAAISLAGLAGGALALLTK